MNVESFVLRDIFTITITHHVSLSGLDIGVDSVRAAESQVLAHPLLHMSQ